jgi:hypothetical protein
MKEKTKKLVPTITHKIIPSYKFLIVCNTPKCKQRGRG